MTDAYDLGRFVAAQDGVHDRALAELKAGAKRSHWMWFIFPQIAGLGASPMAQRYAIGSLGEARPTWRIRCWRAPARLHGSRQRRRPGARPTRSSDRPTT